MSLQSSLAAWHTLVAKKDMSALHTLVHKDAVFRSPFAFKPYEGRAALVFVLSNVIEVFDDFTYHREMVDADGGHAFLEFTAKVGGKSLKGIDMIAFNDDGMITEFEVMIRPMSGLIALAEHMAPRMTKLEVQKYRKV